MVTPKKYVPRRGDVVWLSFNPQSGHEQSGRRPAVVLSEEIYNGKTGLSLFCPITNQIKGYPFAVLLPAKFGVSGAVLVDQVKNRDWKARNAEYIMSLPAGSLQEIFDKLNALLDFP